MNNKTSNTAPDAAKVWKQLEDVLVHQLRLSVLDRSIYSHLLRHSRLEGKPRLRFSIQWLARAVRVTARPVREAVRRLVSLGALRLLERTKVGHLVEVRLPGEIASQDSGNRHTPTSALHLEDIDFLQTPALRQSIHARERGLCFYCLRRLKPSQKCLDHVVPRVQLGRNSYRNLVSCCLECNLQKGERPARDFLRWLYREQRLTSDELAGRLRALDSLAAGKLRPLLPPAATAPLPGSVHPACPEPRREPRRPCPASRSQRVPARAASAPSRVAASVPPPPGGPANPFPRMGRPRKDSILTH